MKTDMRNSVFWFVWVCVASAGIPVLAAEPDANAAPGEWNQWRGPNRTGVTVGGPALAETWPEKGLVPLWKSEEQIPPMGGGQYGCDTGMGSPVACGGKVYWYFTIPTNAPVLTRTIDPQLIQKIGGFDRKRMTPRLLEEMELALKANPRSPEASVTGRTVWAVQWVKDNVRTNEMKAWGAFVQKRLERGGPALDVLDKLEEAIDNPEKKLVLESAQALEKWLDEQKITGPDRESIIKAMPLIKDVGDDTVLCMSAETGKTLWKVKFEGLRGGTHSASSPCIVGDRLYVALTTGAYCLNTATGETIWSWKWPKPGALPCSFVVADGFAFVKGGGGLRAFDAKTGEPAWCQDGIGGGISSPVVWRNGGQTYVICVNEAWGKPEIACADAKTGRILWRIPGGGVSTPVVEGDVVVLGLGAELIAYKMSPTGAERLWTIPQAPRPNTHTGNATPLIYEGHVYLPDGGSVVCCDLKTGAIAWRETNVTYNACCSSGAIADGKLFGVGGGRIAGIFMTPASPEYKTTARSPDLSPVLCTSPVIADGRLFLRQETCIAAYDLRKPASDKESPPKQDGGK